MSFEGRDEQLQSKTLLCPFPRRLLKTSGRGIQGDKARSAGALTLTATNLPFQTAL
jgi:hypothetical protein